MNKNLKAEQQIEIAGDPEQVWDALVNPEKIKQYLFGTEATSDWKKGSEIIFQGEWNGQKYRDKGIITAFEPNKLFSYDYWTGFSGLEDKAENYSPVTFSLSSEAGKTLLTVKQQGFVNEEAQQHSESGWKNILGEIKGIVEGERR